LLWLATLSPLAVLIAIPIRLDSIGSVFFIQKRFGFHNQIIEVVKFRTMYVDCGDPPAAKRTVRHDPRVTRVGRILRLLSFDELPKLINVVRCEMSLVGSRPHVMELKTGDRLYCDAVGCAWSLLHRALVALV
jgi:polysaccharide biosynthesis protein PslA